MAKRALLGAGLLLVLAVAFYGGFAIGNRRAFSWMMRSLETEVVGSQNYRISQLALIRSDDLDRAVQLMETQVDAALSTLPQGREWEDLSESVRKTLVVSKKYRKLYPPTRPSPSLEEALAFVPDLPLDAESCDPAVKHLLERGES